MKDEEYMKTAQEVAEQLAQEIVLMSRQERYASAVQFEDVVLNLLTAYADERVKEAVEEKDRQTRISEVLIQENKEAWSKARAEALEEAAKVAEAPFSPESKNENGKCYECDCHGECPQDYISAKIRALKNRP